MNTLKIKHEFERLIPPLYDKEFELLEKNIVAEGEIFTPIFTWNGYIIDGHHRYKILLKHKDVKYRVTEKTFANEYEAISWICDNQLGRRNLSSQYRKYLIGKRYEAEKMAHGGDRKSKEQKSMGKKCPLISETPHVTRERIAKETGTTQAYVKTASQFAKGVDAAEEAVPGIKKDILSGEIRKQDKEVAAIAKAPPEERKSLTENLRMAKIDVKPSKATMNKIRRIASDMRKDKPPVSEESALESLDESIKMMIDCCESIFIGHPKLLLDKQYHLKVMEIMQKATDYIEKLKGAIDIG